VGRPFEVGGGERPFVADFLGRELKALSRDFANGFKSSSFGLNGGAVGVDVLDWEEVSFKLQAERGACLGCQVVYNTLERRLGDPRVCVLSIRTSGNGAEQGSGRRLLWDKIYLGTGVGVVG